MPHQLQTSLPLDQRVSSNALLLLKAGEQVASDVDVVRAHDWLLRSPPNRENLLRTGLQ
jgi:hypothetical protein